MTVTRSEAGESVLQGAGSLRLHIKLVKLVLSEIDKQAQPIADTDSATLGELGSCFLQLSRQAGVQPREDGGQQAGAGLQSIYDDVGGQTPRKTSRPSILSGKSEVQSDAYAHASDGGLSLHRHSPAQRWSRASSFLLDAEPRVDLQDCKLPVMTGNQSLVRPSPSLVRPNQSLVRQVVSLRGSSVGDVKPVNPRCMLRASSPARVAWDVVMALSLLYVAVVVPYMFAFDELQPSEAIQFADLVVDGLFCLDVLLNFRTGFVDKDGCDVLDWRRVAWRYSTTWLLVDLVSSVPIGKLSAGMDSGSTTGQDMQPATKLLKTGKVVRALKLFKVGKLMSLMDRVEVIETLDEAVTSSRFQTKARLTSILMSTVVLCHWMACFMVASGHGYLAEYQDVQGSVWRQYVAALYWSMTTMTTTGYGDIIPGSDWERAYAMIAMVIGGSFYGYVIGSIASFISKDDLNKRAYQEGMDLILAWLDHHQFPSYLRRRVRRYFKAFLIEKSAMDESAILSDLSPELREDVGKFLIHDVVRYNPLFKDLPSKGVLAHLVQIQQKVTAEMNDCIVEMGEEGSTMFIILEGTAEMEVRASCSDLDEKQPFTSLGSGGSFGEEVVLGMEEQYRYSVTATSHVVMMMLPRVNFLAIFKGMPKVFDQMKANCTGEVCTRLDSKGNAVRVRLNFSAASDRRRSIARHSLSDDSSRDVIRIEALNMAGTSSSCTSFRRSRSDHPYHRASGSKANL